MIFYKFGSSPIPGRVKLPLYDTFLKLRSWVLNCFLKLIISWLWRDRNTCLPFTGKIHPEQWPLIDVYHTYKYKFLLFSASVHRRTKLQFTMEENSLKSFPSLSSIVDTLNMSLMFLSHFVDVILIWFMITLSFYKPQNGCSIFPVFI